MISRKAEPVSHDGPYKRIDLNPIRRTPPPTGLEALAEASDHAARLAEGERIWKITKQMVEGGGGSSQDAAEEDDEAYLTF